MTKFIKMFRLNVKPELLFTTNYKIFPIKKRCLDKSQVFS